MNKYNLDGQIALVTGGAQGIGLAVSKRLSESGAHIIIFDLDETAIKNALSLLPENCSGLKVDVSDYNLVNEALIELLKSHGKVDILINSAGIAGPNAKVVDYPIGDWKKIIETNLDGTFNMCKSVLPIMLQNDYGRIVNIASIAGKEGNPNAAAYSASKAAVIALTKSLGKEHANDNVAINCVTPAAVRTRIFDQMTEEHINFMLAKIPRGRFLEVDEVASMISWLSSEENSFSTGAVFDLSGGRATY